LSELLNPGNFEFFARYLLAGYVVMIVRSGFVAARRPKTTELIVEAVIFSLINQIAFQLIIWPVPNQFLEIIGDRSQFFIQILVLPAIIGSILGLSLSRGWNNAVLRRLSLPISQPVHRAHDFAFTNDRAAGLIIITYFDGTVVYGYFGEQSLAASDTERSDIYLERLYNVASDGQWSELSPPRGALLALRDVRSIEFLEEEREAK